jgi:hypothetical protein
MKKVTFLVGVGVGFALGSRAGSRPYEQLEARVRKVAGRPETRRAVHQVQGAAREQAGAALHKIGEKLPTSHKDDGLGGDLDHATIDPEYIAGDGEEAADLGLTGLEVSE